jgi:hypothetical protein
MSFSKFHVFVLLAGLLSLIPPSSAALSPLSARTAIEQTELQPNGNQVGLPGRFDLSPSIHLAQSSATNYPLRIEKGLVGDSRIWVRVNGWILNVEEWEPTTNPNIPDHVLLAGFANYCKKQVRVNGQDIVVLVQRIFRGSDGAGITQWSAQYANGRPIRDLELLSSLGNSFDVPPSPPLHELVPPPTPTSYPLIVQTDRRGKKYVTVNGQRLFIKDQIKDQQGRTLYFLDIFYALAEKETTIDSGTKKRRVFFDIQDGTPYEVITKPNGQLISTKPLPTIKRLEQRLPFAYFPPDSGYSLSENARGYRGGLGMEGITDPNSLPQNRPECPSRR